MEMLHLVQNHLAVLLVIVYSEACDIFLILKVVYTEKAKTNHCASVIVNIH